MHVEWMICDMSSRARYPRRLLRSALTDDWNLVSQDAAAITFLFPDGRFAETSVSRSYCSTLLTENEIAIVLVLRLTGSLPLITPVPNQVRF